LECKAELYWPTTTPDAAIWRRLEGLFRSRLNDFSNRFRTDTGRKVNPSAARFVLGKFFTLCQIEICPQSIGGEAVNPIIPAPVRAI
jgi:hypothetical protein